MKTQLIAYGLKSCFVLMVILSAHRSSSQVNHYESSFSYMGPSDRAYYPQPAMNDSGQVPATSLYLEIGGKFMYSVNIDFRRKINYAIGLGCMYWNETDDNTNEIYQHLWLPSISGYYFLGKKRRFELGGGMGPFIGTKQSLLAMMIFANAGYRYQKKQGLIFRIGFTPFLGLPIHEDAKLFAMPWGGLSIGYSF